MVEARVVIAIIAVVMLILLVIFWPFGSKTATHTTTTTVKTTTGSSGTNSVTTGSKAPQNTTTTVAGPVKVVYWAVNYQWVYSGPNAQQGEDCFYSTHTTYAESGDQYLNGSQSFYLILYPTTNACPYQINSINSSTSGFVVESVDPALPFPLPAYSAALMQIEVRAPDVSYYGPITITIHYT